MHSAIPALLINKKIGAIRRVGAKVEKTRQTNPLQDDQKLTFIVTLAMLSKSTNYYE